MIPLMVEDRVVLLRTDSSDPRQRTVNDPLNYFVDLRSGDVRLVR